MPWVYSVGSGTPSSYTWTGLNTYNQHCASLNIPSNGAITQLKVYASAKDSTVSTRLCLWNVGGSALAQTSTFTMSVGSLSAGGQSWITKSITPEVVSSGNYWVGLYRNPSGAHIFGIGSGNGYRKTNTSSFPSVSSMTGYNTDTGDEPYVGAFYITSPDVITSLSVTRVSDSKQTVSWTNHNTSDQPYDSIELYRYDNVSGNWYLHKTLSGSSTSYSDTTTKTNVYYGYKVRPKNSAGTASFTSAVYIETTPSAPTNVVAVRSGTTIVLTWGNPARVEDNMTVQRKTSTDGVTWGSYSTLTSSLAPNTTTYTDTSPANYNQYQVKATVTSPALSSAYTASNIIQILVAPNAPSSLSPSGYAGKDFTISLPVSWQHNSVDSSTQTAYSLRFRPVGSGTWTVTTGKVTSANQYTSMNMASFTVGNWEWQASTYGACTTGGTDGGGQSAWSTSSYFRLIHKPVVSITNINDDDVLTTSLLTVSWDYSQDESYAQAYYQINLYTDSDVLVESIYESGTITTKSFTTPLVDNSSYYITLNVIETNGLSSDTVSVIFSTTFTKPAQPTFEYILDMDYGIITINVTNYSGDIETSYNIVYRSTDNINFTEVGTCDPNSSISDYLLPIGVTCYYKVTSVSITPTTQDSEVQTIDTYGFTGMYFINAGDNLDTILKLIGDSSIGVTFDLQTVVKQFEGRTYPLKFQSQKQKETITLSADLPFSLYNTLLEVITYVGNTYYRDWNGRNFYCAILNPAITKKSQTAYTFNCTIERVEV